MFGEIPRDSGESLPLFTIYLDLLMGYIGLVIFCEAYVYLAVGKADHHRRQPPHWFVYFINQIAICFGLKPVHVPNPTRKPSNRIVLFVAEHMGLSETKVVQHGKRSLHTSWVLIARLINRILSILYVTALIWTPIIIYSILPPLQPAQ